MKHRETGEGRNCQQQCKRYCKFKTREKKKKQLLTELRRHPEEKSTILDLLSKLGPARKELASGNWSHRG